ncbi:hypothetical protein BH20ACT7_BH20ACT7_19570 [soil metagenome]
MPQVAHLVGLGEEAVPADVEAAAAVLLGAGDATDAHGIRLDHRRRRQPG